VVKELLFGSHDGSLDPRASPQPLVCVIAINTWDGSINMNDPEHVRLARAFTTSKSTQGAYDVQYLNDPFDSRNDEDSEDVNAEENEGYSRVRSVLV